jgi:hypothetical protein
MHRPQGVSEFLLREWQLQRREALNGRKHGREPQIPCPRGGCPEHGGVEVVEDPLLVDVVREDAPLKVKSFYLIPAKMCGGTSMEKGDVPFVELAEAIGVPLPLVGFQFLVGERQPRLDLNIFLFEII